MALYALALLVAESLTLVLEERGTTRDNDPNQGPWPKLSNQHPGVQGFVFHSPSFRGESSDGLIGAGAVLVCFRLHGSIIGSEGGRPK